MKRVGVIAAIALAGAVLVASAAWAGVVCGSMSSGMV